MPARGAIFKEAREAAHDPPSNEIIQNHMFTSSNRSSRYAVIPSAVATREQPRSASGIGSDEARLAAAIAASLCPSTSSDDARMKLATEASLQEKAREDSRERVELVWQTNFAVAKSEATAREEASRRAKTHANDGAVMKMAQALSWMDTQKHHTQEERDFNERLRIALERSRSSR